MPPYPTRGLPHGVQQRWFTWGGGLEGPVRVPSGLLSGGGVVELSLKHRSRWGSGFLIKKVQNQKKEGGAVVLVSSKT